MKMKKLIRTVAFAVCLTMTVPAVTPSVGVETVEAATKNYNYKNVKKRFDTVTISQSEGYNYLFRILADGKTNVYPINIKDNTEYIVGLTDKAYGKGSILLLDSDGNHIYEKDLNLSFESWKTTLSLTKGKYFIKVLSKESIGFDYELYIKPVVTVKKDTKNLKIYSCEIKELKPELGNGKWTTSNSKVVSIISKNPKNNSSCKIRAKKTGTATVTYTNKNGSVLKYKFTVKARSTYPLGDAYFTTNSVGGLEPAILISNNSNKKIKYIYLTASFYNAVGDRVYNEIGGYKNAKLQITGYINPWDYDWYYWDPVFYDSTATKMKIETMQIVYSDGSKKNMKINKKYSIR